MHKWFALAVQVATTLAFVAGVGHAQERRTNPLRPQSATDGNAPVAQDAAERDKLCGQAMQLAAREQWEDAIRAAQQGLQIQRTYLGPRQPEAFAILEYLAVWQDRAAHYSDAAATWSELQQLSAQVRGEKHWSTVCARVFADSCRKATGQSQQNQQRLGQASVLSFRADQQMAAGKYAEARDLARQAMDIRSEILGADDAVTAISGHTLGTALLASGNAKDAQTILEQCAASREKLFGMNNPYTLATFTSLAALYLKLEQPDRVREILGKLLTANSGLYGPEHPNTLAVLQQLGDFELGQNNLGDAEKLLELTKERRLKIYQGKHLEIAQTCKSLGRLFLLKGDLQQAEENYQAALKLYEDLAGKTDPETARALVDLAFVEKLKRKPDEAIADLRRAIEIFTAALGADHPDTVDANHMLATILPQVGDYAHAETLYRQVLQSYQKAYSENDERVGLVLMQLGTLYVSWNDYGNAETYLRRALAVYRQALGNEHSNTAGILSMLSLVDARVGRFQQAEEECKTALRLTEQALGANNSQTVAATLALGNLYLLEEKYDAAQQLLQDLLAKQPETTDDQRYHNAIIREKLAAISLADRRYAEAIKYADLATQVYNRLLPEYHPHRLEALKISAIAEVALKHYDSARPQIDQSLEIARRQLDSAAMSQSERQQLALNFRLREILDLQLSLPPRLVDAQQAYRQVLQWKGAVEARQIRQRQQVRPEDAPLLAELQSTVVRFATMSLNVPDGDERKRWLTELDELKQRKESLEAELVRNSQSFKSELSQHTITPEKLQSLLPANTGLVDILEYVQFSGGHDAQAPDETRYVAFVVRHDKPVERVDLGPVKAIDDLVEACRTDCLFQVDGKSAALLSRLRDLIWSPIAPLVKDCHTVLYSPDAGLARFPLSALPGDRPGRFLIEDYAIGILPVPRMAAELLNAPSSPALPLGDADLLLVGDIDYDAAAGQDDSSQQNQLGKQNLGGELLSFERLKSAPSELQSLQSEFRDQYPAGKMQILQQAGATESAFRHQAPQHRWLFVATHGFFAPPNVSAALAVQDELAGIDPLHAASHSGALCGLALAGANQAPQTDRDDGILTAYEVSALDLRHVDLVVLSGCETALGDSAPGEGAMSLQRAFQIAGAGTTVASLWSVPDEKTKDLMHLFLTNMWQKKMPKLEALRAAQIAILHASSNLAANDSDNSRNLRNAAANVGTIKNPSAADASPAVSARPATLPPYYWAAFVLSGDWR